MNIIKNRYGGRTDTTMKFIEFREADVLLKRHIHSGYAASRIDVSTRHFPQGNRYVMQTITDFREIKNPKSFLVSQPKIFKDLYPHSFKREERIRSIRIEAGHSLHLTSDVNRIVWLFNDGVILITDHHIGLMPLLKKYEHLFDGLRIHITGAHSRTQDVEAYAAQYSKQDGKCASALRRFRFSIGLSYRCGDEKGWY